MNSNSFKKHLSGQVQGKNYNEGTFSNPDSNNNSFEQQLMTGLIESPLNEGPLYSKFFEKQNSQMQDQKSLSQENQSMNLLNNSSVVLS
mmetsp:Transcript_32223/g.31535  ORF Transcript_32223/g.31535 Transcript_32223/m.31535 type:complete len:89 (+) Transcript_32223:7-273(+)